MKKAAFVIVSVLASATMFAEGRFSPIGMSIGFYPTPVGTPEEGVAQFPLPEDGVYGFRLALGCVANRNMVGLAPAVYANDDAAARGYVGGLQVAPAFNTAGMGELGVWQLSGFYNKVVDSANGFQACAFWNEVERGYFYGLQTALGNKVSADFCGMQIGLYNAGEATMGMQIGLWNSAKSLCGMQIGLLSCVHDAPLICCPVLRFGW